MDITIPTSISDQRVGDLLCCAIEGGIGYWAAIVGYEKPEQMPSKGVLGDEKITRYIDYPIAGGAVLFQAPEDDSTDDDEGFYVDPDGQRLPVYRLDREALTRGMKIMQDKYPRHFGNFISENDDAETGDVFVQCCLLGEIVYG